MSETPKSQGAECGTLSKIQMLVATRLEVAVALQRLLRRLLRCLRFAQNIPCTVMHFVYHFFTAGVSKHWFMMLCWDSTERAHVFVYAHHIAMLFDQPLLSSAASGTTHAPKGCPDRICSRPSHRRTMTTHHRCLLNRC